MRRKLLFLLFFCIATIAKAENEPVITLNVEVNEAKITLGFEVSTPNTKLSIDWGDGVLVETEIIQTPDQIGRAHGLNSSHPSSSRMPSSA